MQETRPLPSDTLGSFLRRAREATGVTVRQVSELVGTHYSTIARIEQGIVRAPRFEMLKRIANVLDIDLADLYALSGVPIAPTKILADYLHRQAGFRLPTAAVTEAEAAIAAIVEKYRPGPKAS